MEPTGQNLAMLNKSMDVLSLVMIHSVNGPPVIVMEELKTEHTLFTTHLEMEDVNVPLTNPSMRTEHANLLRIALILDLPVKPLLTVMMNWPVLKTDVFLDLKLEDLTAIGQNL
jgi:hypothetical protein